MTETQERTARRSKAGVQIFKTEPKGLLLTGRGVCQVGSGCEGPIGGPPCEVMVSPPARVRCGQKEEAEECNPEGLGELTVRFLAHNCTKRKKPELLPGLCIKAQI